MRPRAKIWGPVHANLLKISMAALMKSQAKIVMVYRMSVLALILTIPSLDKSISQVI